MEEKLITFDTAKLAKEKGFNWKTNKIWMFGCPPWEDDDYWYPEKDIWYHRDRDYLCDIPYHEPWYYSPTQGHLQKWLREVHGIQVYAYSMTKNGDGVYRDYVAHILGKEGYGISVNDPRDEEYQTYEEALEVGLQHALNLIKTP